MVGGILGAGGVAYMARQFKNRPKDMKISVYLIHTRMYAQMTVVGKSNSSVLAFLCSVAQASKKEKFHACYFQEYCAVGC